MRTILDRRPARFHVPPVAGLAAGLLVVLVASGCTSDEGASGPGAEAPPLPDRSVGSSATLEPRPVPMDVRVARVAGSRLRKSQRREVEDQAVRVLSEYFDRAFLGGGYPRTDYPRAFAGFTPGARRAARRDVVHLTNGPAGGAITGAVARRKWVRLDVFSPRDTVAGMTARFHLVFVATRERGADQRVTVQGRLQMNRSADGPWQIFGYDVRRSAVPAGKGGRS
jgi:hypothetical protein